MKSSSFSKFIIIFVMSLLVLNCAKENKKGNADLTIEELLVSHPWNGIEVTRYVNGDATTTTPITGYKYVFTDDNTYKKYHNNTLIQDGTWEVISSSSIDFVRTRYYDSNLNHNILDDLQIVQLTSDVFEYSMPYIDNSGDMKRDQYKYGK